ncbi:MAG: hypothetical protein JJU13_00065 [Balneolaceae bacterium]|nr:hypothetical protein [Balneolaceae bacterium]
MQVPLRDDTTNSEISQSLNFYILILPWHQLENDLNGMTGEMPGERWYVPSLPGLRNVTFPFLPHAKAWSYIRSSLTGFILIIFLSPVARSFVSSEYSDYPILYHCHDIILKTVIPYLKTSRQ